MRFDAKSHPVIIRTRTRRVEEDDEEHGTWKIAYADFTTAMMAFFLLLWLISITSESQKEGLADFFNPVSLSRSNSGGDGVLAGRSTDTEGTLTSPHARGERAIPVSAPPTESTIGEAERSPYVAGRLASAGAPEGPDERPEEDGGTAAAPGDGSNRPAALSETVRYSRIKAEIRDSIQKDPRLNDLTDNVLFQQHLEGLRVIVTDEPHFSMFAVGDAALTEKARTLITSIAEVVRSVPNQLAVVGHTDARPYAAASTAYTNWELSADRANAARRALLGGGVPEDQVARVEGLADRDLLYPSDPLDPRNRRIAITVLRETPQARDLLSQ